MIWKTVKNTDLSVGEKLQIAELKNQYWPYGIASQIRWMKDNIQKNDVHLMGEEIDSSAILKAYITLSDLNIVVDGKSNSSIGIGGVCVDAALQHSGVGKQLMEAANRYIETQRKMGVLLCKNNLIGFYKKCGWKQLSFQTAVVAGFKYKYNIMSFNSDCSCSEITIDRNF